MSEAVAQQPGKLTRKQEILLGIVVVAVVLIYAWNRVAIMTFFAPHGSYVAQEKKHRGSAEPTWRTLPGYRWRSDWVKLFGTQWTPGLYDPERHRTSGLREGTYLMQAGYGWSSSQGRAYWVPGVRHPEYLNIVAGADEGQWSPAPGYQFANSVAGDFTVFPVVAASAQRGSNVASGLWKIGVGAVGCKLGEQDADDSIVTTIVKAGLREKCGPTIAEGINELVQ